MNTWTIHLIIFIIFACASALALVTIIDDRRGPWSERWEERMIVIAMCVATIMHLHTNWNC